MNDPIQRGGGGRGRRPTLPVPHVATKRQTRPLSKGEKTTLIPTKIGGQKTTFVISEKREEHIFFIFQK
jgi:hypothetical protein